MASQTGGNEFGRGFYQGFKVLHGLSGQQERRHRCLSLTGSPCDLVVLGVCVRRGSVAVFTVSPNAKQLIFNKPLFIICVKHLRLAAGYPSLLDQLEFT